MMIGNHHRPHHVTSRSARCLPQRTYGRGQRQLYPQIATTLKRSFAGWDCFFFTGDLRMPKLMRLKPSRKTPVYNGALECRLFEFKMVSGSNREVK